MGGVQLKARLAEKPRPSFAIARLRDAGNPPEDSSNRFEHPLAGIEVQELTAAFLIRFHLPSNTRGAALVRIKPGSPADIAGLRQGDLIQEIDHQPITSAPDFQRIAANHRRNRALVLVNRAGRTFFAVLEAQE
ncbi:MAG: PDZ domain-containing protein [Acidobacteria bacterium]|nr:PDZ domain-containing protein [Acidobacteriota bacterium]